VECRTIFWWFGKSRHLIRHVPFAVQSMSSRKGRTPVWTREDAKNCWIQIPRIRCPVYGFGAHRRDVLSYVRADSVRRRLRRHEKAARGRKCQCIIRWSKSLNEYILWTQAFRASNPLFQSVSIATTLALRVGSGRRPRIFCLLWDVTLGRLSLQVSPANETFFQ
jgi:hypothetical protein